MAQVLELLPADGGGDVVLDYALVTDERAVLHLATADERTQAIREPPLQVLRDGELACVEDHAAGGIGARCGQRFAGFGLILARDVSAFAVRAYVGSSVAGNLARLVLARKHVPV